MKAVLLLGIFFSTYVFASEKNYSFKCSMTSINNGTKSPFNGRMVKKDGATFTLKLDQSIIISDSDKYEIEFKSMSCSNQAISADYQGTAFSDCIIYSEDSDSVSGNFLRLTWPSYDMLSLNFKDKKQFSRVTYLESIPYGMSGGEQPGKKIADLNCTIK